WLSGNQWVADESTILLEQAMYIHGSDIKLWEWFSGAFGGWSRAAAFLQDQGFPISVVGASDIDPHSTQIWNMNRKLINKKEVVDAQIMDVRDIEHWEKVMEAETNCVTLSSSCKSFSLAGLKKGWQSEDGQTLACALLLAAKHGFRCILLENVANLKHDPKLYQILTAVLDFCGLEIAYEGVISMTGIHPVERTRLIMVVKQKHDEEVQESESNFMSHYEQKAGISLWETKRWMTLSEELMYDLILDDQTIEKYAKQSSMTYAMRQKVQVWNRVSALFARAITSNMAMPAGTMMAGYNHQHVIAETTGSNQILGSLRHVKDLTFRFVHPIEVVLAMGSVFGIVLPRNIRLSMNGVGNCISEMHALIGLATGFKLWKRLFPKVRSCHETLNPPQPVPDIRASESIRKHPKASVHPVPNCIRPTAVSQGFGNASEPTNGNHASEVSELVAAENALNMDSEVVGVFGDDDEDDPMTPTEPFSVVEGPECDANQGPREISRIVERITNNIRDGLSRINNLPHQDDPLAAAKRRLDLLCLMGPAIGDDEMAFHVSAIQQAAQEPFALVLWDSIAERWNRDQASSCTDLFHDSHRKSLVCWIHAHWVPVIFENRHDQIVIEYINSTALTESQVRSLCELCNCRSAHASWIFHESAQGWCGFEALAWICAKLQTALAPMYNQEKQDILHDMSQIVEQENFTSYCQRTEGFNEQMSICLTMRLRFIRSVFVRPTIATMHGFGTDEPKPNLKLAGKLAAILIGHGHGDQESIRVSHELADRHASQARSIPTMKDARAYATILELTVQHGIQISTLTKTQAVAKLQKFFRLKYEKRRNATSDDMVYKNDPWNVASNPQRTKSTTVPGIAQTEPKTRAASAANE
ncbi:unnamed protein product, partial [Cladocopium goreaui]